MNPVAATNGIDLLSDRGSVAIPHSAQEAQGFSQLVADVVQSTNDQQLQADNVLKSFATGQTDNVQDVVVAMAKADLSFKFLLEVRNQLVESYQEISRMQV